MLCSHQTWIILFLALYYLQEKFVIYAWVSLLTNIFTLRGRRFWHVFFHLCIEFAFDVNTVYVSASNWIMKDTKLQIDNKIWHRFYKSVYFTWIAHFIFMLVQVQSNEIPLSTIWDDWLVSTAAILNQDSFPTSGMSPPIVPSMVSHRRLSLLMFIYNSAGKHTCVFRSCPHGWPELLWCVTETDSGVESLQRDGEERW